MPRTTSYTLGERLNAFIRDQVEGGAYQSASEVVREALETFAEEKQKETRLLAELQEGEASGRPVAHERVWKGVWKRTRVKAQAKKRAR